MKKNSKCPLVSVIVPVYNVEDYLEECVRSIIAQSYKNLEIILVDDGSTDGCPSMCDALQKNDSRIAVIHKKNGGLSDARNVGLDIASGEYVCFVDSDDYIDGKYVEKLLVALESTGADMSVCGYVNVRLDGTKDINEKPERAILNTDKYWEVFLLQMHISFVVAWNKLYKKSIFDDLRYAKGKINEDEIILLDLLKKCKSISVISDFLYYYRQRPDSIMMSEKKRGVSMDVCDSFIARAEYFLELKRYDLCIIQIKRVFSGTYDGKQARKCAKRMAGILREVPKEYKDKRLKLKVFVFRFFPCLYGLKRLRKV